MRRVLVTLPLLLVLVATVAPAAEEGTRHITGTAVDMYFMNDKVFGTVSGYPLWALYNCGSDINGEMDVKGTYHKFSFAYHQEGDKKITGTFSSQEMSLGAVDKQENGFLYHVFIGDKEHTFSIRYEALESEHLVNSVIEGALPDGKQLRLTVDGRLCPFATTGIILIAVGSSLLG